MPPIPGSGIGENDPGFGIPRLQSLLISNEDQLMCIMFFFVIFLRLFVLVTV